MAAFETGFDANNVDPTTRPDPIPAGLYQVVITESEEKPNAKGTGSYHQFTLEVIEGEYKNRHLWARLNLKNPNEQAVAISRAELSAICRAVGVMAPKDSTELHDLPCTIKVGLEKRKDTGELTNIIKGWIPNATATKPEAKKPAAPPWKKPGR